MGGAASKDFIDGQPRTTVARELDELGGYDRPALAKNQSFTARLDWLGTQVGKASEQIEAALSKDDQAGRRELEKEAKRRQLMAVRRGQGDFQLNAQFAEFYLKQKQFERPPVGSSASILRNAPVANAAADAAVAAEPGSPKSESMRRSSEQVATLQRLYSNKNGPGSFASRGAKPASDAGSGASEGGAKEEAAPAPPAAAPPAAPVPSAATRGPIPGSRWRQTVAQAKKTAFLAVGTVLAMNGKRRLGPNRIDNFALYAEQQMGEGMPKFIEETERLAAAREKLPGMRAELEKLRAAMRLLAVEQEAALAAAGGEEGDDDEEEAIGEEISAVNVNDGMSPEEAANVASSAAAAMRNKRSSASGMDSDKPSKPRWHYGSGGGFGAPPPLSSLPKPKPFSPRLKVSTNGAESSSSGSTPGHTAFTYTPASPVPSPGLPTVSPTGPAGSFGPLGRRRRPSIGSPPLSSSLNGPVSLLAGAPTPGSAGPAPGLGMAAGLNRRASLARASWSGAMGATEAFGSQVLASGSDKTRAASASGASGAPLRPSRPAGSALAQRAVGPSNLRSSSEPSTAAGPSAAAAVAAAATAARPASAARTQLLSPRPPSAAVAPGAHRPVANKAGAGEPSRASPDGLGHGHGSGEYRVGTMAQRIASRVAQPLRTAAKAQLKALREAETANVMRQAQLVASIEESTAILQTAGQLLNMYCNRANGRWVELQQWALPYVHEVTLPAVRRQAERYKELVMKDLRAGKLAVMIHVDDDVFLSSRLGSVPLWSMDPWQLLSLTHPARAEWTAHLNGLGMGVRQLLALATAVEAAAGPEAVAKMMVVIACHDGQVDAVVRDVSARKLCRFNPENVIIMMQQRTPGHVYDRARRTFVPTPEAPPRPAGSGYAMLALNWSGEDVFRLGGPELTQRMPMEKSTLALFAERDVQWLSSWRLRDLVHYSPEGCLNLEQLAVSYALADSLDANMSMQVDLVDTMHGVNRAGSGMVLALKERAAPPPPPTAAVASVPLLRPRVSTISGPSPADTAAAQASAGTAGPSPPLASTSPTSEGIWPTPASSILTTRSMSPAPPSAAEPAVPGAKQPSPPDQPPPLSHPHPHLRPRPQSPLHIPSAHPLSVSAPNSPMPISPRSALVAGSAGGQRAASGKARPGGIGGDGGPLPTCDIKWPDVQTPALASGLQQLIDAAAEQTGSQPRLAVSIKRYAFHVPSLKDLLTSPSVFRPCVSVGENGFLYVTFDSSDLTALPAARCVALTYSTRSAGGAASAAPGNSAPESASVETRDGDSSGGAAAHLPLVSTSPSAQSPPSSSGSPAAGTAANSTGGAPVGLHSAPERAGSGLGSPARRARGVTARPGRAGSGSPAALSHGGANSASVAQAAAQAAAAAMQRGRLLTNDHDLDTLAWVVSDQDAHPAFRASVSSTNTARSRVTAHAPGGAAAATGGPLGPGRSVAHHVIVVAVTDDLASQLAVRAAMAIMKPGADCLHVLTIAKDISAQAVATARAVAERFESMAAATLGDVRSVVQVKQHSVVEDVLGYAESVRAVLLVTGSMNLASQQGSGVVGSVALSLARDCSRPILVVKSNARLVESVYEVGKKPCLRALLAAEPTGRPLVRFVVSHVLDGARGDKVVLLRGRAFDKQMNELTSSRRILDHLADEATSNRRFESSCVVRRMVQNSFDAEHQRVADADQCHIVGVQVPDGRGPLPASIVNLLRTSRAAVLLYRSQPNRPAPHPVSEPAQQAEQQEQPAQEEQRKPEPPQLQQQPGQKPEPRPKQQLKPLEHVPQQPKQTEQERQVQQPQSQESA